MTTAMPTDALPDLPAPTYRSEAFAEDLFAPEPGPAPALRRFARPLLGLLLAAPFGLALAGVLLAHA